MRQGSCSIRAWSSFPTRRVLHWWTLGNITVSDASYRRFSCTDLTPKVPCLQPSADQDSKQSGLALFLCGYMAIEKYSLLSTRWVAGPSPLLSGLTPIQCPRRRLQIDPAVPARRHLESSHPRHRSLRKRLPHLATLHRQYGPLACALYARNQHAQGANFRPKRRSASAFGGVTDRNAAHGVVHDGVDVGHFESEIGGGAKERDAVGGVFDTQSESGLRSFACALLLM